MYQNESFGMMDEGYFVPRSEIISWINALLRLNITKVQALGAGNIYCQILDVIYPGKVSLSKVNWKAKLDYEFINNLKILQGSFDKLGIKKHIEVQKLSKAKYQDNLQLIQWLKRYFDINCGGRGDNYPAQERRGFVQPDFSFAQKIVIPKIFNQQVRQTTVTQPVNRPKKMTSPNLGLDRPTKDILASPQTKRFSNISKTKKVSSQLTLLQEQDRYEQTQTRSHKLIRQQKHQAPQSQQTCQTKSAHQQKLQLISDILAKGDLSSDQKLKLIEEVMTL